MTTVKQIDENFPMSRWRKAITRARRSLIVAGLIFPLVNIASLWLSVPPAAAKWEICNKTGYPIELAIGYAERNRFASKGWWNIAGGRCATVVGGDLKERIYYYYADHLQVGGKWAGNYPFCVSRNTFTIIGDKNCASRGYEERGFKRIDTGNSTSWKTDLTDTGGGRATPPPRRKQVIID